ncbi:MAG: class I SAM-dependent DNA methyltransferase [Bacteroidales bacterium]|nr:class I SAM-dependent DNA methyltransferase [Bacteroidales bacterium]
MIITEKKKAAKEFAEEWAGRGDEKQETQRFWIQLLQNVLGIADGASYIEFEKRVKLSHTSFIDAYISSTKVLIEQKGLKIDLHKAYEQSDGTVLTPFEQAKRYVGEMKASEKPRWIIVCNFAEFLVYDLEKPQDKPEQIFLKDFVQDFYRLQFIVDNKNENIHREEELSVKAGKLVGKLYDAILPEYKNPDEKSFRSLNILCVRIVFCLYAEDAGLFEQRTSFEDYIKSFNLQSVRKGIIDLFRALDTKIQDRDKYDTTLTPFPYVNGGLFRDENIEIPNFTQNIVDVIVNECAPFNWSEISPTIFGAVFESTLNPETRRKGGMHYTSIANIHKVIDPLFLNDLESEFESICEKSTVKQKSGNLVKFQEKLGNLTFLDPACGSGNFLTETYISLRRLENKVLSILNKGWKNLGLDNLIQVNINQFYGIEINDFAVTVAKTALWIAESQMMAETEAIVSQNLDFLPLKNQANIVEGNALRMDWRTLKPIDKNNIPNEGLFSGFTTETDGKKHTYDYIMGNPPFIGARMMEQGSEQKQEIQQLFGNIKDVQDLDYVCGWYRKAADFIKGANTEVAFVSTNSICQGAQVPILWNVLLNDFGAKINIAYQTFKWQSESTNQAAVHCVIVGFANYDRKEKMLFMSDGIVKKVSNISPYLIEGQSVFVEAEKEPICDVPKMNFGNQPRDGGYFVLSEEEKNDLLKKEPSIEKFIRPYIGADEFIKGKERFCLWLKNASPLEIKNSKILYERVSAVREFRIASKAKTTNGYAKVPNLFAQITQPENVDYIIVPSVSSERRRYVPIGFATANVISSNAVQIIPHATIYHFGVLTSSVHMAWMRVVAGRLKSDYRYSKELVYNTFPWCEPTNEQKAKIEKTAQLILDARSKYPDCPLSVLNDVNTMPSELRKAHAANDHAVMEAYGFAEGMSDEAIVGELFKLYEKMTTKQSKTKTTSKSKDKKISKTKKSRK